MAGNFGFFGIDFDVGKRLLVEFLDVPLKFANVIDCHFQRFHFGNTFGTIFQTFDRLTQMDEGKVDIFDTTTFSSIAMGDHLWRFLAVGNVFGRREGRRGRG